jgi:hypothetical protein
MSHALIDCTHRTHGKIMVVVLACTMTLVWAAALTWSMTLVVVAQ